VEILTVLFVIAIVLFVVELVLTSKAKAGGHTTCTLSQEEVILIVRGLVTKPLWTEVDGAGEVNMRRRVLPAGQGPVVSIEIESLDDGTTSVRVWMSRWYSQLGMAKGAEFAVLKIKKILGTLQQ